MYLQLPIPCVASKALAYILALSTMQWSLVGRKQNQDSTQEVTQRYQGENDVP